MIGAITLTLRHRPVRRQDIGRQVSRLRADAVELRKVRSGSGV
jgi:NADH-quinone oxidoreductase subunit J